MRDNANHKVDLELVRRVLSRDREAFERFFDAYFSRLYRFCIARVADEGTCEDIVQETLIKALQKLDGYRGEAALFSWLCQICRHEISNWYRRRGEKQQALVSLDDDPQLRSALESFNALDGLDESERLVVEKLVILTLDYLPEHYSRVLEYMYLEGLSVKEISDRLNTGVVAVQSLLARARVAFRRGFNDLQREVKAPPLGNK